MECNDRNCKELHIKGTRTKKNQLPLTERNLNEDWRINENQRTPTSIPAHGKGVGLSRNRYAFAANTPNQHQFSNLSERSIFSRGHDLNRLNGVAGGLAQSRYSLGNQLNRIDDHNVGNYNGNSNPEYNPRSAGGVSRRNEWRPTESDATNFLDVGRNDLENSVRELIKELRNQKYEREFPKLTKTNAYCRNCQE